MKFLDRRHNSKVVAAAGIHPQEPGFSRLVRNRPTASWEETRVISI